MKEKLITLKFNDGSGVAYNFKHAPFVRPFYANAYVEATNMVNEALTGAKKTFQDLSQIGNHVVNHDFDILGGFERLPIFNEQAATYLLGEFASDIV